MSTFNYNMMLYERHRLNSFEDWRFSSIQLMAKTGLFYNRFNEVVECYFCGAEIRQLRDDVIDQHLNMSPECPLLTGKDTHNVPIDGADLNVDKSWKIKLCYHRYGTFEARIRSFDRGWPIILASKTSDLAKEGFFYTGVGDKVECFACGGDLNNWKPDDDVHNLHKLICPRCPLLNIE